MAIKVSLREGAPQCLYCRDDVAVGGVACPECGVRYHDECAMTFGRCGVLGCKVPLLAPRDAGRPLPRMAAIAPRLMTLDVETVEGDDHVVVVLPGARDDRDRAAFVGSLLGATAFDGRSRLLSVVPEPLLRVGGAAEAEGLCARLAEHGVRAVGMRADAFLRPLLHVAVTDVEPLAVPLRYRTSSGREAAFPAAADRLLVTTQLVEERPRPEARSGPRDTVGEVAKTERRVEQAALVFSREDPDPLLLRRDGTRIHGLADPTAFSRFAALVAALRRGATLVDFKGSSSPILLARRRPIADKVSENLAGVLLSARVLRAAWLAGV